MPRFFLLLLTIAVVLLILTGIRLLTKSGSSPRARRKKVQDDVRKMREEITPFIAQLISMTNEELELLSYNQLNQTIKRGKVTTAKGIFTTVYQEPVIAYSYKQYDGHKSAVIYARTKEQEYTYRINDNKIAIAIDKVYFGTIQDGNLFVGEENQFIGQLESGGSPKTAPIKINEQNIAAFHDPKASSSPNPRVFKYFNKDLEGTERKAFLSLTILELVESTVQ